jgi:hypothetical protein
MKKTSISAIPGFASIVLVGVFATDAHAQFYRDAYFEAECPDTSSGSYRTRQTNIAGYSGSGFLRSGGNTTAAAFNNTSSDRATYTFKAYRRGTFTPWFRVNTNNSASDDSFYYRIDGGDWITMSSIPGGSGWRWVGGVGMFMSEGNHTLEIANREDGFNIDKFGMLYEGSTAPTGTGGAAYNCPTPVYFESECRTSAWGEYVWDKKAKSGHSGAGYLEAVTTNTDVNTSADEVVYPFETGAAAYNFFFRINNNASGSNDSWFYRIDDGPWVTMNNTSGLGSGWRWAQGAGAVTLARGQHTLRVRAREAGLGLDKLAFVPTTASGPSGTALGGTGVNCEPFKNMSDWDYFDVLAYYDTHTNYMAAHGHHMLPEHVGWHDRNGPGGEEGPGSGTAFLGFHRAMMNDLRRFAMETGGRSWLPINTVGAAIPAWLPDSAAAMDLAGLWDSYFPRNDAEVLDFGIPTYLTVSTSTSVWRDQTVEIDGVTYQWLGDIPDLDTLGRVVAAANTKPGVREGTSYHFSFHILVGGTMGDVYSPADPIFYGWHGLIDKVVDNWLATAKGQAWAAANAGHPFLQVGFTGHHDWENVNFD